jgi:hypothetical protein
MRRICCLGSHISTFCKVKNYKKGVVDIHLCIENKSSLLYINLVGTRGKIQHVVGHCGRDRMIVGFPTTYAIRIYHHLRC